MNANANANTKIITANEMFAKLTSKINIAKYYLPFVIEAIEKDSKFSDADNKFHVRFGTVRITALAYKADEKKRYPKVIKAEIETCILELKKELEKLGYDVFIENHFFSISFGPGE